MSVKRILTAVLAAALTVCLAAPVGAVSSSFSDVKDTQTAINADVLRLMGVVSGVGGNQFNPNDPLTRAQFCAMVVQFMGKGDQVPLHATRTIFSDVTAKHWGLGYINLAATKEDEKSPPLISGVGDGRFEPDAKITLEQATTILIRVLNYGSDKTGAVWPQSYMNLAKSIGLTEGLASSGSAPVTRAQAAQLFVNALGCKTGAGADYYTTLVGTGGSTKEDVVFLAVNVDSDDGRSNGAIRTSGGTYLPAAEGVTPTALQGRRGALVVNDKKEIITFVPDDSTSVTITLSGDAQPTYVKGGGTQYTVTSATPVYTSDKEEGSNYTTAYASLKSGTQLTLFSERGKVVAVYASGSTATTTDAVVVKGSPSTAMFHQLTGGATNFSVQKNRQAISISQIKQYDVVTYDSMTNTLIVSDLRLSCVYEDASPSAKAPETVNVLGYKFPVLESAWDSIGQCAIGDQISLLLTADGKVAGMEKSSSSVRSNAVGVVSGATSAKMFLPNGGTIELKGSKSKLENLQDNLVSISSGTRDQIGASRLSSGTVQGIFDVDAMKLGSYTVTAGVRIYEKVGTASVEVGITGLDGMTVSGSDIEAYHLNSSGMVDYIVLKAVTGDAYTYGKLEEGTRSGGEAPMTYTNRTVTVINGTKGLGEMVTGYSFKDGSFGGVVGGYGEVDGLTKAASVIELTELKKVTASDFFTSQGVSYVNAGGKTYRVADDVECYKAVTKEWLKEKDGAERLASCKAFSSELTIYVDPIGEKVRIVVGN